MRKIGGSAQPSRGGDLLWQSTDIKWHGRRTGPTKVEFHFMRRATETRKVTCAGRSRAASGWLTLITLTIMASAARQHRAARLSRSFARQQTTTHPPAVCGLAVVGSREANVHGLAVDSNTSRQSQPAKVACKLHDAADCQSHRTSPREGRASVQYT